MRAVDRELALELEKAAGPVAERLKADRFVGPAPATAVEWREVDSTEKYSALRSLWSRKIRKSAGLERDHSVGA